MLTREPNLEMRTATVADIAIQFPRAIDILNRYNLDFCCQGRKLFVEACEKAGLVPASVWSEIMEKEFISGPDQRRDFMTWGASFLIDYIIENHHQYVRNAIPQIQELLAKVCLVHAGEHPELIEVRSTFGELAAELLDHLAKEEAILFPLVRSVAEKNECSIDSPLSYGLEMPVAAMVHEHDSAGELLKSLRSLTTSYRAPTDACPTFQVTYKLLKDFDSDLTQHIHLENNVLFPKAKADR